MSIDAKDLHALYAPLWEKLPETRPVMLCSKPEGETWPIATPGMGSPDQPIDYFQLDAENAAALCRVAVEDWIMARSWYFTIQNFDERPGGYGIRIWDRDGQSVGGADGPTVHHALVAAAMAVAGVKA